MSNTITGTPSVRVPTPAMGRRLDLMVRGLLDGAAVLQLRKRIATAVADGPVMTLVDVTGVSQVTASGLAGTLELLHLLRRKGGDLRLYGLSPAVAQAHQTTKLAAVVPVYRDRPDALAGGAHRQTIKRQQRSGSIRPAKGRLGVLEARLKRQVQQGVLFPASLAELRRADGSPMADLRKYQPVREEGATR